MVDEGGQERERGGGRRAKGKLNTLGSRQLVTRDMVQLSRLSHPLLSYIFPSFRAPLPPSLSLSFILIHLRFLLWCLFSPFSPSPSFSLSSLHLYFFFLASRACSSWSNIPRVCIHIQRLCVLRIYTYYSVTSGYYTGGWRCHYCPEQSPVPTKGTTSRHRWSTRFIRRASCSSLILGLAIVFQIAVTTSYRVILSPNVNLPYLLELCNSSLLYTRPDTRCFSS